MIDKNALRGISYGLYLISSNLDGKPAGCTVNTFAQVTSSPLQVSVAVNKENATCDAIRQTGAYVATILTEEAPMELIGGFGFHSSRDTDKFAPFETAVDEQGVTYVREHAAACVSVKVTQEVDLGSHLLFIGEVVAAEVLGGGAPMTYAYYHEVKKGKTPPKASSYLAEEAPAPTAAAGEGEAAPKRIAWRCTICGYIEEVDELPDDFVCPICGVGKEMFERIEL